MEQQASVCFILCDSKMKYQKIFFKPEQYGSADKELASPWKNGLLDLQSKHVFSGTWAEMLYA